MKHFSTPSFTTLRRWPNFRLSNGAFFDHHYPVALPFVAHFSIDKHKDTSIRNEMDHFRSIYKTKADEYHQLITVEDVEGNLLRELERIADFREKRVLDLGTGTGRIPLMLHQKASRIIGLDLHDAMLREQAAQKTRVSGDWDLMQGDMHTIPFQGNTVDIVIAGWALGHFQSWFEGDWQVRVDRVINEMKWVAEPQGCLIIIETLGTGSLEPAPPHEGLAEYYARLEKTLGFEKRSIRTDYQFKSVDDAIEKTEFFFGPELSEKIRLNKWSRLPEWTGVWVKRL